MNYILVIFIACHIILVTSVVDVQAKNDHQQNVKQSTKVPTTTIVDNIKLPTILIVTLFRNKAHIMPSFFTYLNQLDYPKDRISLW